MKLHKMPILIIILSLLSLVVLMTGCTSQTADASDASNEGKLIIVTSLFPHYNFAQTIAGDYAEVTLLLPPGTEAHTYEPTPKEIIKITESDLFLYTSEVMEPWAYALIETVDESQTTIIDMSTGIEPMASNHNDEETEAASETDHEEGEVDPHYWLDPTNAQIMVETIQAALIEKMPEQKAYFEANAKVLLSELEALDREFVDTFEKTESKTILSGGHFAFGYFAKRYGLENMSPYVGFSPDAEPTSKRIVELIETIKVTKAKAIFYEELIDPRVAKIISEEAGVEMLLLHGAHNLSKDELEGGTTYIQIMKGNLERLKIGLGYVE